MTERGKPITVNVPLSLDRKLARQARSRLISKSALIRMVLDEHVRKIEAGREGDR